MWGFLTVHRTKSGVRNSSVEFTWKNLFRWSSNEYCGHFLLLLPETYPLFLTIGPQARPLTENRFRQKKCILDVFALYNSWIANSFLSVYILDLQTESEQNLHKIIYISSKDMKSYSSNLSLLSFYDCCLLTLWQCLVSSRPLQSI